MAKEKKEANKIKNAEETENEKKELGSVEIGKIAEEKPMSSVSLIIFFVILLAVALGLPYIDELKAKIKGDPEINSPTEKEKDKDNEDDDDLGNEDKYYDLKTSTFTYNNLIFSNITLNYSTDYSIKFNISTTKETSTDLANNQYYIELYNADKTLVERVKLATTITVSKVAPQEAEFPISATSYSSATLIKIIKLEKDNYPALTLSNNSLVCTNLTNTITYRFEEEKLYEIEDLNTYNSTMSNYDYFLNSKRSEVASLNNQNGISSSLVESSTGFVVSTLISLAEAGKQNNKYYYSINTEPKTIEFEMEAMRFNCE